MSVSGSESFEDGQFLVRVRAQVMTRDDSSGGWVPLGGGGLSNVSVRKKIPEKNEYVIQGKRISDQSIVLSCTIKKDFEYNKVMPTFHHWKTGNKKFGLTFQTAADARAFDKGVRMAVEDLLDGVSESSPLHKYTIDTGDDDVFMALELPVERDSSSSASSRASVTCSQAQQIPPHSHLHRMYFSSKSNNGVRDGNGESSCSGIYPERHLESKDKLYSEKDINREEVYSSYVQFQRGPHDYSYPIVPEPQGKSSRSTSIMTNCASVISQPKMPLTLDPLNLPAPPLLPTKTMGSSVKKQRICGKRRRCRDCNEVYSEDSNPRASCETGPDPVRRGIDAISCMGCARGMLYHCVSGSEGDVPPHPCALRHHRCKRRWLALGLLSLILPCLCLYPPLIGCHYMARKCGICGARHHPS